MELEYLKTRSKVKPDGFSKSFRVIHEGLKNRPDLKESIISVANKILDVANNENSHLTDVACSIQFSINDLQKIAKDIFEAHEIEKYSD